MVDVPERVLPRNTRAPPGFRALFECDARSIAAAAVGAGEQDVVLFTGSGCTAAIDRLINLLGLRIPSEAHDRFGVADVIAEDRRPVVFIGPYEHHSNELPWRESLADVVVIPPDRHGHVDLEVLGEELRRYGPRRLLIGSFSAASNVTGLLTDADAVATLLHRHGAQANVMNSLVHTGVKSAGCENRITHLPA